MRPRDLGGSKPEPEDSSSPPTRSARARAARQASIFPTPGAGEEAPVPRPAFLEQEEATAPDLDGLEVYGEWQGLQAAVEYAEQLRQAGEYAEQERSVVDAVFEASTICFTRRVRSLASASASSSARRRRGIRIISSRARASLCSGSVAAVNA